MLKKTLYLIILALFLISCKEVDLSQVSDDDLQRISEKLIVCDSPYLRNGAGCCLDSNNDRICDQDQTTEPPPPSNDNHEDTIAEPPPAPVTISLGEGLDGPIIAEIGILPKTVIITNAIPGNALILGLSRIDITGISSMGVTLEIKGEGTQTLFIQPGNSIEAESLDGTIQFSRENDIIRLERLSNPHSYPNR